MSEGYRETMNEYERFNDELEANRRIFEELRGKIRSVRDLAGTTRWAGSIGRLLQSIAGEN